MRLTHRARAAAALALALSAGACDQGLTGLNDNPNAPTNVPPQYLFPQGATALVGLARGAGMDERFTSLWAQHYAEIQYPDDDQYELRPSSIDAWWTAFYSGGLQDLTTTIEKAQALERPNMVAPAVIMKQWAFGLMTAIWGDIPYSQANQGAANTTPVYDPQEEVFAGMFTALADAVAMLDPDDPNTYGATDPIYGGDPTAWRKFANSLRLRYAYWLANVDPTTAQSEFAAAMTAPGGVFTSNADNAMLVWPGDGINESPLYGDMVTGNRDDHRVSKTLVDILQDDANDTTVTSKNPTDFQDPRLPIFAELPDSVPTQYIGVTNGLSAAAALALGLAYTSRIGETFVQPDAPSYLMTYAEVEFIIAEMMRRGYTWPGATGTTVTHYQAGIRASMELYGIPETQITTYLAQPAVALGTNIGIDASTDEDREKIALQKWIALYGQGIEAWTEYRLTGVPNLQAGPAAVIDIVPRRLTYPLAEQSFNNANLQAAIQAQGSDDLEEDLWFTAP